MFRHCLKIKNKTNSESLVMGLVVYDGRNCPFALRTCVSVCWIRSCYYRCCSLFLFLYIYSSLFTISGRQLKHTEINRETEIRQTKYTK